MDEKEIFEKFIELIKPYVKNKESLDSADNNTTILNDLAVNSSRLVDVIIAMEDKFGIEISDEDAEKVGTIGDAVKLIQSKA